RSVYNTILAWRTEAFQQEKTRIGYKEASARLTALKKDPDRAYLNEVSCVPLQQCLRHQQQAFQAFLDKRAGYPTTKSKKHRQSAEFTASAFKYQDGQLFLAKCKESLDIRWTKKRETLPSAPSTVTVSRDTAGRYFVSLLCEVETELLPVTPRTTGIDLGLKALFVTAEGEQIDNPRHTAKYAARLAKAQRALSRKQRGSKNRAKARQKVARLHTKIADTRLDGLHKLSRRVINENQVVCVESLAVKNLVRNRRLSKSIADAGWGELVRQLEYKAAWAGRQLVKLDRWFPSSKRCSCCGHTLASLPLKVRDWTCPACGSEHDRDLNAAINIKAAGLAVLALGEDVSGIGCVPLS
ncbi:MAG TPA: RNA-guided endonuclease TnpB family protein, partial [Pseudomonas sp.]